LSQRKNRDQLDPFAEAMAVGDGKVLATGTSSRRYTTVTKSTSSRIAAVT
jgi:hypothetical protein